jgi:hypothetical protein
MVFSGASSFGGGMMGTELFSFFFFFFLSWAE